MAEAMIVKLRNMATSKYLDVFEKGKKGAPVVMAKGYQSDTQLWVVLQSEEEGFFYLANKNSGAVLDCSDFGSQMAGCVVWDLYFKHDATGTNATQKWCISDEGDGSVKLVNHSKNNCLDVVVTQDEFNKCVVHTPYETPTQKWIIEKVL